MTGKHNHADIIHFTMNPKKRFFTIKRVFQLNGMNE